MTLLLSRSDLERLLDVRSCVEELRRGFTAPPSGTGAQRVRTDLPGPGTATALIPGLVDGIPAYTVKVNAKFPAGLTAAAAAGTLGDILRGTVPGRTADTETTIYTPVGLPWQDLALAWTAYQLARGSGTGRHFDFLT